MDDHGGKRFIDPVLLALIEKSEKDGGLWIKHIPEDTIIRIHARDALFLLAFTDVTTGSAAIQGGGRHFPSPTLCRVNGSTFGGSAIKLGWLGRGMHLEAALGVVGGPITEESLRRRRTLTTASIRAITMEHDPEHWQEMTRAAKPYEPE